MSCAVTTRLWAPGASPIRVSGLEQGLGGPLSRPQEKVAPTTLARKANVALVASVRSGGNDVISVSGCSVGENAMSSILAVEMLTNAIDALLASITTGVHTFGAGVFTIGV